MNKRLTPLVSVMLAGTILLQSCATIIAGSRQSILISGQPEGSTIYVNDQAAATRPVAGAPGAVRVLVPRKQNAEIKVKHEGYKEYNEVLTSDHSSHLTWLNYLPLLAIPTGLAALTSTTDSNGNSSTSYIPFLAAVLVPVAGAIVDHSTGANRRFSKKEVHPQMMRLPQGVAGGQTVQAGAINVRIKGGDKMGNLFVMKEPREILYFGKSLDVDADNLRSTTNATLKELGFNVPSTESKSMFSTAFSSRYTLQGEMHELKYDVVASNLYEHLAHYETRCTVSVTWKLVNQGRQTVYEHKDSGTAVKFEKGGSAAFEAAFENSLYAFLANAEATTALAKPMGTTPDKQAAISLRRAAAPKVTDNGVGAAARCVVIVETADGHGSGCVVSADGYIITNAHVVGDQNEVSVLMADGVTTKASVVRVNSEMDLALLKINAEGLSAFLLPSASTAEIGADVFAIGTPADKELGQTVTKGIISGRRKIDGHAFLQTDVSINGGNSGGALVAHSGQLLGIVNAKLVGRGIEGIGFAIPAEQVADALQLKYID